MDGCEQAAVIAGVNKTDGARLQVLQHLFQMSMPITEASNVMAIMAAGNVKSQWPDASGSLRSSSLWKSSLALNSQEIQVSDSILVQMVKEW
jgi:hypothetical protein